MKIKNIVLLFVVLTLAISATPLYAATKYIEGFSSSNIDSFPRGWRTRPGQKGGAELAYKVKDEGGNKYLAADDINNQSIQIFKMTYWDLEKFPILSWKWRAQKLPIGGNETVPSKNDSACGLYISFGMSRGQALKYVWSTTASNETVYKKNDKMYIIVKQSGGGAKGQWVFEKTNVLDDAKKVFGSIPDRTLSGIAVLTDGNATHTPSACDYDSIGYSEVPETTEKTVVN